MIYISIFPAGILSGLNFISKLQNLPNKLEIQFTNKLEIQFTNNEKSLVLFCN